jgi:bacillithiol biosynthesis cysteine-adding enzyme BshC
MPLSKHFSRNLQTMSSSCVHIPFSTTHLFSKLINDYVEGKGTAQEFVQYAPNQEGYQAAIDGRKLHPVNRALLVEVLTSQYANLQPEAAVNDNIALLKKDNTFVVTTAHQPNLFSGPLYFFYKIIHAIQLAASLKVQFPQHDFVPVYYMGSEDADLDEVGAFNLEATRYQWNTKQTGAIGRMQVDDALLKLIQQLEGYWAILPQGQKALAILKEAYQKGKTINEATLYFVHAFFGSKGLLILQPDDAKLKAAFIPVMEKELLTQFSHQAIQPAIVRLANEYHVQTEGRSLNLFYLKDQTRARIEKQGDLYIVVDTDMQFTESEIIAELHQYPERFSPNVILRGVYQETILPGVVFVGGGGELAYWMELKNVFQQVGVHYPLLQLRNSFLLMNQKQAAQWKEMQFEEQDLFKPLLDLEIAYVKKHASEALHLNGQLDTLASLYAAIKNEVVKVDPTLGAHAENLAHQAKAKLEELEKKMVRAERRKQAVAIQRIHRIKKELFPQDNLQERVENFSKWVGQQDLAWFNTIMENSTGLESRFSIITID